MAAIERRGAERIGEYGQWRERLMAGILRCLKAIAAASAKRGSKLPTGIRMFPMHPFTAPMQSVAGAFQLLKSTSGTPNDPIVSR